MDDKEYFTPEACRFVVGAICDPANVVSEKEWNRTSPTPTSA